MILRIIAGAKDVSTPRKVFHVLKFCYYARYFQIDLRELRQRRLKHKPTQD